ncbi:MAG TPA: hypothetical protein VN372_03885 [Methanospirillum sp.]|nr:hypothetical protein [Methanospirillum sp.]
MKQGPWIYLFAAVLLLLSFILFTIHYLLFGDLHHILLYTVHDVAFLPIEVLLVTVVIHSLLEKRSLQMKLEKLNMVIGTFFSVSGTEMLKEFVRADPALSAMQPDLKIDSRWDAAMYKRQKKVVSGFAFQVDMDAINLVHLRDIMVRQEDFLIRILENPVMLEHESFTDLLLAVFHLVEELRNRDDLTSLPHSDIIHLKGDIRRVYSLMTLSWLDYMNYLQGSYPYLYSLAVRLNPFGEQPDVIVRE